MTNSDSKQLILKKIRTALKNRPDTETTIDTQIDFESNIYNKSEETLEITFAEEFKKVQGNYIFCENENELINNLKLLYKKESWHSIYCLDNKIQQILNSSQIPFSNKKEDFMQLEAGITRAEFLIARLGSIMITSKQTSGRRLNVFPPVHIVIAYTSQLVYDLKDAFDGIKKKYKDQLPSMISIITGPSRTADIEKTLVLGAHGPKKLFVFLVNDK